MSAVTLTVWRGLSVVVDTDDAVLARKYRWSVSLQNGKPYAKTWIDGKLVYLHRWLTGAVAGQIVDHADGDTLNCQRSNLRITDRSGNNRNRRANRENATGFKGVIPRGKRFQAAIAVGGKQWNLGRFPTAELAARAYDAAARQYFGDFARLNFPTRALAGGDRG